MLGLAESGYFQLSGLHRTQDPRAKPANPTGGGSHQPQNVGDARSCGGCPSIDVGGVVLVLYGVTTGLPTGTRGAHEVCTVRGTLRNLSSPWGSGSRRWISTAAAQQEWGSPLPASSVVHRCPGKPQAAVRPGTPARSTQCITALLTPFGSQDIHLSENRCRTSREAEADRTRGSVAAMLCVLAMASGSRTFVLQR